MLEPPTGNASDGLGSGHVNAFLPLWLQKKFGDWTVYGGGGYGINPGAGNENWGFVGAVVQKQVTRNFLLGGEIHHRTKMITSGRDDTVFNLGTVIDFTEHQHLFSPPDARLTARRTFNVMSPGNSPSARNFSISSAISSATDLG